MIFKALYILQRPQPQNPECVHTGLCPLASPSNAEAPSKARPTTQNRTTNEVAATPSSRRSVSGLRMELELPECTMLLFLCPAICSLHSRAVSEGLAETAPLEDRKSTRLNSSHLVISY